MCIRDSVVAERVDRLPAIDPHLPRTLGDLARRAEADRERRGDLAMASPLLPFQSKNLSGLAHGQSLRRHSTPFGAPGKHRPRRIARVTLTGASRLQAPSD